MSDYGHWEYPIDFDPSDWFGFIYRIIDTNNGMEYIGKKQFHSKLTKPPLKGQKRKRKIIKESDWKTYTSSSTHVNEAITTNGKDTFVFLIESLHKTKAALHYAEVEAQVLENVLREKTNDGAKKYYNKLIANIKFIPPDETPEELEHRIRKSRVVAWLNHQSKLMETKHFIDEWRDRYRIPSDNPIKGRRTATEWSEWLTETYGPNKKPLD